MMYRSHQATRLAGLLLSLLGVATLLIAPRPSSSAARRPAAARAAATLAPMADLAVTKLTAPGKVLANSTLTYTITVINSGPDAADTVSVGDNLPAGLSFISCQATAGGACSTAAGSNRTVTFTSLAPGASATITLAASVNCAVADGAVLNNTALISSLTSDPNSNNNSASAATAVSNPVWLSPPRQLFAAGGGGGSANVTLPSGCGWSASTTASWITFPGASSGTGSGTLGYAVAANPNNFGARTDSITINGLTHAVRQGAAFLDVPAPTQTDPGHQFYSFIGKLSALGVTSGCGGGNYCPENPVTREQMAAFIIKAKGIFNPSTDVPQRFLDVPKFIDNDPNRPNSFYGFIDQMGALGITSGCGGGNYCPQATVTREQMAAFIIRALGVFNPPTPAQPRFLDVGPDNGFYSFIEQMAVRGITAGCGGGNYCPKDNVTRGQMAVFLVRAFGTPNQAPLVSAGSDQAITLPTNAVNLSGMAVDDGLPAGSTLAVAWSKVSGPGTVTFGNAQAAATQASFSAAGVYVLRLTANDSQLSGSDEVTITVNSNQTNQPPTVNAGSNQTITLPNTASLSGTASDDGLPAGVLSFDWSKVSGPGTVIFSNASGLATTASFSVEGVYVLRLTANDSQLTASADVTITVNADPTPLPPDPAQVATPIDPTVATTIGAATQFLYTGPNPIQTGVAAGMIKLERAAVLRGRVLDKNSSPLSRVKITVLSHPEFGQTLSRADGKFDLAVNGGGPLTLNYEKTGFLPVQRNEDVPWQDYVMLPDVVMMGYDPQVTLVDLSANIPMQVAQGTAMTDSSGTRRATLLFAQGTTATMKLPDGSTQGIIKLHVRATEYTVGANGPAAMPGELPATSAYTYAVEYSIDEAVAVGATSVLFSQPVIQYLDNFLNFPIGVIVPVGSYDRASGIWMPEANGRVVKILSISGGQANLDVSGSGQAATNAEYQALGITTAERQRLATLYTAGQSFWRVPIVHFSPQDCNWGGIIASGSTLPAVQATCDGKRPCPPDEDGSIINCDSQALGERVNVVGTPFSLNYFSDRVPGRTANNTLTIPLSDANAPAGLKRIELEVTVAGRMFRQTFSGAPSQTTTFTWDGKDAYNRTVQGQQPVTVRVGYVYDWFYIYPARFGEYGDAVSTAFLRGENVYWQSQKLVIGVFDARGLGLGGWSLSEHHAYDPTGQILYMGNGQQRVLNSVDNIINTFAGGGSPADGLGDGLPATQAQLSITQGGIIVAPDGTIYFADDQHHRVRKIATNGIISTVAGTGTGGYNGDGIAATQAQLNLPLGLALAPDGSLYISEVGDNRIRKVSPSGIITTAGGNGTAGYSGDGGPATQARLNGPRSIALAPDGSLYIADASNLAVRRIAPDGIISTVAVASGGGGAFTAKARTPSSPATLQSPRAVAVGPDGFLYVSDVYRVVRINPDRSETVIAGKFPPTSDPGDGGPATEASLNADGIAFGPDGSLYLTDGGLRVRIVTPDGIIRRIAGNSTFGYSGDGGPALQAQFMDTVNVVVGADGNLYLTDLTHIRKVSRTLPGFTASSIAIPSSDGSELYQFSSTGRHLSTINTLTGANIYVFSYDSAGHLSQVTDGDGNATTIEHDANGKPTAIVGPFGQRTNLTVDANGFLSSITDPASQAYQLAYTSGGLLTSFTNPRNQTSTFTYDALGRLMKDTDAATGFKSLARTELSDGHTTTLTTALGRTTSYQSRDLSTGDQQRINTDRAGFQTQTIRGGNAVIKTTYPDGMVDTVTQAGDPRWKMQAPLPGTVTSKTPAGLLSTSTFARTVTLSDPNNLLSLAAQNDTFTINGLTYTRNYAAATRTFTSITPVGRQRTTTIDTQGRITQSQFASLNAANFTYDTRGRLSTGVFGAAAQARSFSLSYNTDGYLSSITDPLARTTSFVYDTAGRVTQKTLPDGRTIGFTYDANGNLTSITPPGRPAHVFAYSVVDLLSSYTAPNVGGGNQTTYAYNLDRQLTTITRPDSQTLNFAYDSGGRLSTLTIPGGAYTFSYNATTGNLSGITAPGGGTLAYTYDGSLLTQTSWAGTVVGSVSRVFDNNFRVTSQSINGANTINLNYDNDSLLVGAGNLTLTRNAQNGLITGTTLGGVTDSRSYTGFGELSSYGVSYNATGFHSVSYTYDKLGRITQKIETIGGGTDTYDYTYDTAGRLAQVKKNNVVTATYTYDSNSNRLSYTGAGPAINGTYDNQDRLTQYGSATYAYTANGELTSKTVGALVTTYQYDVVGNLKQVTLPNSTQITYLIDGQNRRIGKKVGGTLVQGFLYQNALSPVTELDGSNSVVSRFVYASRANVPDYMIRGGVTYRIISDHLGSPRLVVDVATGNVAQRIDYDEFGVVMTDTNPGFQPFGYAGGLYDKDTGLVRFGARDYDAQTGRWTVKDPILFAGGDTNLYGYVLNDPINFLDPDGLRGDESTNGIDYFLAVLKSLNDDRPYQGLSPDFFPYFYKDPRYEELSNKRSEEVGKILDSDCPEEVKNKKIAEVDKKYEPLFDDVINKRWEDLVKKAGYDPKDFGLPTTKEKIDAENAAKKKPY